jgi:hypothetical protein
MSRILYGPIEIHNAQIRDWQQTVEYDPSHTDAIFTRFSIRVEGIVHMQSLGASSGPGSVSGTPAWTLPSAGAQGTATSVYQQILSYLNLPRLQLQVLVGNGKDNWEQLLYCTPALDAALNQNNLQSAGPHLDVDNGPKPKLLAISHLAANNCYRISWQVECAKVVCLLSAGASTVPAVLNNRWSLEEDMDENCKITRTIAGDLRLSAPVALLQNDYRALVVPNLEQGFKRTGMRFGTDKTGLNVNYTVTDKQVQTSAPWPATSIDATHTELTNDGVNMSSEMRVRLTGNPGADTQMLITRAVQVMDARLSFLKRIGTKDTTLMVESGGLIEHIGEDNAVEAWLRLRQTGTDATKGIFDLLKGNLGTPLALADVDGQPQPYDSTVSMMPWFYGYNVKDGEQRPGVLLLLQCYLQQPCAGNHGINTTSQQPSTGTPVYESPTPTPGNTDTTSGGTGTGNESNVSQSAQKTVYNYSRMESKYCTDELVVQLPIASRPGNPGGTSGDTGTGGADTSGSQPAGSDNADTCVFVKLAGSVAKRVIIYDTEAIGQWPQVMPFPSTYTDGSIKGRLLKHRRGLLPPSLTPDQSQTIYRVHGWAIYGLNRPPTDQDKLSVGVQPFTSFKQSDTQFDPSKAQNAALGPGDGGGTSGGQG